MFTNTSPARLPRHAGWWGLGIAAFVALAVILSGWVQGWRWFDVTTPSMGTAAPVGSLVITKPSSVAQLSPGEVIVFHNPAGRTYSHRVVAVDGSVVTTKGDINGADDPWRTTDAELVGKAVAIAPNVGFLLRGIPWLMAGLILVQLAVRFVQPRWRSQARFLLTVVVIDTVLLIVHPLVGLQAIAYRGTAEGLQATVVSTGIFPVSVTGAGGDYLALHQGEVGAVVSQAVEGRASFTPGLALDWFWWLIVALVVLLPLLWSVLVGFVVPPEEPSQDDAEAGPPAAVGPVAAAVEDSETVRLDDLLVEPAPSRRWAFGLRPSWGQVSAAVVVMLLVVSVAVLPQQAQAAFTAKVQDPNTKLGSRQFFTCLDAIRAFNNHPKGVLYVGYAFGNGLNVAPQTDQSGRGYNITVAGASIPATRACTSDNIVRNQRAWHLSGSGSGVIGNVLATIAPSAGAVNDSNALTWTLWFRTTTTTGGILTCSATAALACTDRTTWMTPGGRIAFQVGNAQLLTAGSYNDGSWHFMAAQLSRNAGMRIWMDGVQQAVNVNVVSGTVVTQGTQWGYSAAPLPVTYANQPTTLRINSDIQMAAIIAETPSGGRIGTQEIQEMYQAATP